MLSLNRQLINIYMKTISPALVNDPSLGENRGGAFAASTPPEQQLHYRPGDISAVI